MAVGNSFIIDYDMSLKGFEKIIDSIYEIRRLFNDYMPDIAQKIKTERLGPRGEDYYKQLDDAVQKVDYLMQVCENACDDERELLIQDRNYENS